MTKPVLEYYNMNGNVTAFSTTRKGGVSKGSYGEFNINAYCGDNVQDVKENRKSLCEELVIGCDSLVMPHQTHGVVIRQIGEEFFSLPEKIKAMLLEGVDGLMTSVPDVCIGVSTADCIPVLLYDEEHKAACAVHAGWRGTVSRIVQAAVTEMRDAFLTNPSLLHVCIGPGISLEHFEVGDEVYEQFANADFDMNAIARFYDKWHIDLPECNRIQLIEKGVPAENIIMSGVCTYSDADKYFSARRLGINSGRIFTGIVIRK